MNIFVLIMSMGTVFSEDPADILKKSDRSRLLAEHLKIELSLETYENDALDTKERLDVYNSGSANSLVRFMDKKRNGQLVLSVAQNMWIYFPRTRKPIRITPMQRLMGQASNGDIARLSYSEDYHATLLREEIYAERACYVLELTAKSKSSTYRKIHYWVEKERYLPVKADYFLISGKHFKSASFEEYRKVNGATVVGTIRYHTLATPHKETIMRFLKL